MKILFVRPEPSPETIGLQHVMVVEPLELEILSALTRPGDEKRLADLIIEKKPLSHFVTEFRPDVVCFTGYITHVKIIIDYCRAIKQLNFFIFTMVGGVHCEVCPADFDDPAVDFRVVRNGVKAFPGLLSHIGSGTPLPPGVLLPGQPCLPDLLPPYDFTVPAPDRQLTARYRKDYFYIFHDKVALLKTSFGCPYHCSFCFCIRITGGRYRQRPLSEVMDELEAIAEEEVYIVDDDFLADKERLQNFIAECRHRGIRKRYLVYGRADFIAENPGLMQMFRETGLRTVIAGLESFDAGELDRYNKHMVPETNPRALEVLNRLGIDCYATLILPPHWDRDDFRRMTRNLVSLGVHFVNLQPLTPLPGTAMDTDDRELLIGRQEYEKWDLAHIALKPSKLSVAGFYREMLKAYHSIIFQPRFLLRHAGRYPPRLLYRMIRGAARVRKQYIQKIKEARKYA